MEDNLIGRGIELMLFGMGTVVIFLTLLVLVTTAMSALVRRYAPEPVPAPAVEDGALADATLLAVITAAIHQHRTRHKS